MRYISVLMIFLSISVFGQRSMAPPSGGGGAIKGKVVDAESSAPIEFSSVSVYKAGEKKPVAIESTIADGSFILKSIPKGEYTLKISFVGYKNSNFDSIQVSGYAPIDMGTIKLALNSTELDAVVVKGEKSLYESKIDRKVFNVDKALVSQSGTAADVLQQVPSVSVDQDGVVSLRGSENVTILVNGRPTLIDKTVLMQQIQANTIEKIEVITNPSVKYDSEGTSGIINIVLKQGVSQGFNGTATINAGSNDDFNKFNKYNGSITLNYNPGKYNLFGSYSYRKDNSYFEGETNKHFLSDTLWNAHNYGTRMRESNSFRLGVDYFVTRNLTIGVNGSYSTGKDEDADLNNGNNFNVNNLLYESWYKSSTGKEDNSSKEFAAYLTQKFAKEGHELKIDYSYGDGSDDEYENTIQDTTFKMSGLASLLKTEKKTGNDFRSNQIISTDYSLPINDKMKLELGGKLNIRNNEDTLLTNYKINSGDSIKDPKNSYDYKYHEDITSIYGTYSLTLGKFSAMAGIKTEFANYKFNYVQDDTLFTSAPVDTIIIKKETEIFNYFFSFIPSLHLVQKLNETNEVNLSYSRRIQRPRGRELSPIPDYSNPSVIQIGNPNLKPEYTNSFELGYTFKPEKYTIQPTLFYRLVQDRFTRYRATNTVTKIDTVTSGNIPYSNSYGFDMAITYQPFRFWNLNFSGSIYQYTIEATKTNPEIQKFSYNGKIMSNTMLPQGFAIQLAAFYRSPFITTQGESEPFYSFNLGMKKDLLKGKLVASLNYNDIFNTMRFAMNSRTNTDFTEMWRKRESNTIFVGLTYKFGKAPKNGKKPQRQNGQDENGGGDDMMY